MSNEQLAFIVFNVWAASLDCGQLAKKFLMWMWFVLWVMWLIRGIFA